MDGKRQKLQDLVGAEPRVTVESYNGWAGTQPRTAVLAVRPETLQHVQAIIRGCHRLGLRVRARGGGHSFCNNIITDEGEVMMYTANKIRRHDGPQMELIQNDNGQKEIQIMAGQTGQQFQDFQLAHDVVVPYNAIILDASIGGLIAPFAHGTGRKGHSLQERITLMRIVDSDGELRTYSLEKDGRDFMRAIQTNLGLFGIMYDVRIHADPTETVRVDEEWIPMNTVINQDYLKELFNNNDHVLMEWIPFEGIKVAADGSVDIKNWSHQKDHMKIGRINKPSNTQSFNASTSYTPIKTDPNLSMVALDISKVLETPDLTPLYNKQAAAILRAKGAEGTNYQKYPRAVHNVLVWPTCTSCSWGIDAGKDYENVLKALKVAFSITEKWAQAGKYPLNVMLWGRLIKANDIYLSPAGAGLDGSGLTFMMEMICHPETAELTDFYNDYTEQMSKLPKAAPHWSKHWHLVPNINDYLSKRYAKEIKQFLSQLEKSGADPDGIFVTKDLEKIFFPEGHPGYAALTKKNTAA